MTRPANRPRVPGTMLLKIAPLVFSERFITAVVEPTIADLQSECAKAGPVRLDRLRAQWRGYRALWMLTFAAPFAFWAVPGRNEDAVVSSLASRRFGAGAIVFTFLALTSAMLGPSGVAITAGGALLAIGIHAWYEGHPSEIPTPSEQAWRPPQINFSSTDVAGNIGGLIFMVGSLLIVSLGLPSVLWFLFAATGAGCFLAWRLVAWHERHPNRGLPENRIVLR